MPLKLAAFDLEIAGSIPDDSGRWRDFSPLGITCAACALGGGSEPRLWQGVPRLTREEGRGLVRDLMGLVDQGFTLVTWNGCGFDFAVLAEETGMVDECAELAMGHVDMMLIVTFTKGHRLALQTALLGAGLPGKLKAVRLSDGTLVEDMDGARAPGLWAAGEHEAVLAYLRQDVAQTLELAHAVLRTKAIRWTSKRGLRQQVLCPKLLTARECLKIPEPDTSWMDAAPKRTDFLDWMPAYAARRGVD